MRHQAGQRDAAAWLALRALGGQAVAVLLTVLLASHLTLVEFEAYVVAASLFVLMVAVAPLGADKAALRVLPPLIAASDWPRVSGFLRFAGGRLAIGTLGIAAAGLGWGLLPGNLGYPARAAIVASALALPAGSVAQLGLEVLTAGGRAAAATSIVQITVPASVLAVIAVRIGAGAPLSGAGVIAVWGIAWLAALPLMLVVLRRDLGPALCAAPRVERQTWRAVLRPLWFYRIGLGLQAQAGILALDWFGSPAAVGAYAAATAIVAPALVLSTATSRAYSREIAMLIDRGEAVGLTRLEARRRRWMVPLVVVFLGGAAVFAGPLLGFFRPEFAAEGRWPLRILAVAAALSIVFALAPTVLKYRDRTATTFRTLALSVALQPILLAILVPRLGATGAALGYAAAAALLYIRFAAAANRELGHIRAEAAGIRPA